VSDAAALSLSAAYPGSRTFEAARRAVVRVAVVDRSSTGDGGRPTHAGFGFVVSEGGTVLTAGRLVTGETKVAVVLPDGRTLPVTTVVLDPLSDLAVLQVRGERLRAVSLGRSGDLRVGDPVVGLGEPGEVMGTVRATGAATGGDLVTDARAGGVGRAGLPLLNVRGEAVGIVTHTSAAGRSAPLDFAVPIDRAKRVLRDFEPAPEVTRGAFPPVVSDR
jgi:S1-C subfamily serine protease